MSKSRPVRLVWAAVVVAGVATVMAAQVSNEDVARRQYENGRANARQGKYDEALKDFRAVAETHSTTAVADNALLEIGRYYLDVVNDQKEAQNAVDTILKKYPTSDSAPDAHIMVGRLALARGRRPADLDTALASFDRVLALFPASDAVPRALVRSAEALLYANRLEEALSNLGRVQVEYSAHDAAADAYLVAGRVLLALGDPILAMEEMQQARNRWSSSPAAATALSRIALLHRLYVRARGGAAYAAAADTVGPAKLQGVQSMVITPRQAIFWAHENGVGAANLPAGDKPVAAPRPRTLALDTNGLVAVIEGTELRAAGGTVSLMRPRTEGAPQPLEEVQAAVQLSTGEWLVADSGTRQIHKYSSSGDYGGVWTQARVTRLAINAIDQVAGLDRDQKVVLLFDASGKQIDRLPLKGTGYVFENPEDLTYDAFGHLYVLDRESIGVFSPHPVKGAAPAAAPAGRGGAAAPAAASRFRLLTVYSEMADKNPAAFRRATAFVVDQAGAIYLADDRAQKIKVYR